MITTQQKALAIISKCTSIPSIFGSSYIVFEVLRDPVKRQKSTYHRLLLAMSISDIFASLAIFVGTWAIPQDNSEGIYLAYGTQTTCNIQGLFIQLGIVTPLYNGMLALYFLMSINWGWKERKIQKIEKFLHAFPLIWGFGTAILCLVFQLYSNATLWCWFGNETNQATTIVRYALYYGPVIFMLLFSTTIMIQIYRYVRRQEKANEKHDIISSSQQQHNNIKIPKSSILLRDSILSFLQENTINIPSIISCSCEKQQNTNGNQQSSMILAAPVLRDNNKEFDIETTTNAEIDIEINNSNNVRGNVPVLSSPAEEKVDTKCVTTMVDVSVSTSTATGTTRSLQQPYPINNNDCITLRRKKQRQRIALKRNKHSKKVMEQSFWYLLAFYSSFLFACATRIMGSITGDPPFSLLLLFSIFFPMQGFFNFLVYIRPRFIELRTRIVTSSRISTFDQALDGQI